MPSHSLDGPRIEPRGAPTALVALLHGYGANGDDLIALGDGWRRQLPLAAFVAPNAPEGVPSQCVVDVALRIIPNLGEARGA